MTCGQSDTTGGWMLRALMWGNASLPIGAYAFSHGLAMAVHQGLVHSEGSLRAWLEGILHHGMVKLDVPHLAALYRALEKEDEEALWRLNDRLLAARGTSELLMEDAEQGASLLRLLEGLGMEEARQWRQKNGGLKAVALATAFSLACQREGVPLLACVLTYLFAFVSQGILAAVKLVPLGQTQGQRTLKALLPAIDQAAAFVDWPPEEAQSETFGLSLLSAQHEALYSRLFRS